MMERRRLRGLEAAIFGDPNPPQLLGPSGMGGLAYVYYICPEFRVGDCRPRSGTIANPLEREQRGSGARALETNKGVGGSRSKDLWWIRRSEDSKLINCRKRNE